MQKSLLDRLSPTAMILLAVVSLQLGLAMAVRLFPVYGPSGVLFMRVAMAGMILAMVYRRSLRAALAHDPGTIALLGACMAAQNWCFFEAIGRLPLGVAVSISFLGPLGMALVTSRQMIDFMWIAMAAAGILMLTPDIGEALDPTGIMLALGSALGWAGFMVMSRRLGKSTKGGAGLSLAMLTIAILLFPLAGIDALVTSFKHPQALLIVAAIALFASAIPLSLEYRALGLMSSRRYGILISTEPIVATLVGAIALGDYIGFTAICAILLISLASVGSTLVRRGRE